MPEISMLMIVGPVVGTFSILLVWLLAAYIIPAKGSPAWLFIQAKKKRKPIFFMDNGSYWKITMGRNEGPGFCEDNEGSMVNITPNSMKSCLGVRMGIGEYNRSIITNPLIMHLIEVAKKHKIDAKNLTAALEEIEKEVKNENPVQKETTTEAGEDSGRDESNGEGLPNSGLLPNQGLPDVGNEPGAERHPTNKDDGHQDSGETGETKA